MKEESKLSTSALVLGTLSIIFFVFFYIAIPTGVLAVVLGSKAIKRNNNSQRKIWNSYRNRWNLNMYDITYYNDCAFLYWCIAHINIMIRS